MAESKKQKKPEAVDETPSGKALAEVGDGPAVKHDNVEAVLAHADKYAEAKKKQRWG